MCQQRLLLAKHLQENSFFLLPVLLLGWLSLWDAASVSSQSRTSSRCLAGRQKEYNSQKKFREAEMKRKEKIPQTKPVTSNLTKAGAKHAHAHKKSDSACPSQRARCSEESGRGGPVQTKSVLQV